MLTTAARPTSSMARTALRALILAVLCAHWVQAVAATGDGHDIYIEDYRLHIECSGRGSPAVILDAGLGGSGL